MKKNIIIKYIYLCHSLSLDQSKKNFTMCFMICRSRFLLLVDFGSIIFVTVLKFIAISKKKTFMARSQRYMYYLSLSIYVSLCRNGNQISLSCKHIFLSKMLQMQQAFCRSIGHSGVHNIYITHTHQTPPLSLSHLLIYRILYDDPITHTQLRNHFAISLLTDLSQSARYLDKASI